MGVSRKFSTGAREDREWCARRVLRRPDHGEYAKEDVVVFRGPADRTGAQAGLNPPEQKSRWTGCPRRQAGEAKRIWK